MNRIDDWIHFNVPPFVPAALEYMQDAALRHKICGDGKYTKLCSGWIEEKTGCAKALLTTSGSTALDLAALLCGIQPGDEVILPSYTFSSTANAFAMRGASLVFVDIRPDTLNLDETKIEAAVTEKTKVIVPVHYAGVACEMDTIMEIARRHGLLVVEDAAQAVTSTYKGRPCGTIGDFGCYSFHETKNFSMGEGGALLIRDPKYITRAEIYREKGTNRSAYYRGEVAKYNWMDVGGSFLPSDLNAAYLWAQLEKAEEIQASRMAIWQRYWDEFAPLAGEWGIELPVIPEECGHNAHMFYIKCRDLEQRTRFIDFMKENKILSVFHYVPLHSAPAGMKYGRFDGEDRYTTAESDRLARLPIYYDMFQEDLEKVVFFVKEFFLHEKSE